MHRSRHSLSNRKARHPKGPKRYWSKSGFTPKCASHTVVLSSFPVAFALPSSTASSNTKLVISIPARSSMALLIPFQMRCRTSILPCLKCCPASIFTQCVFTPSNHSCASGHASAHSPSICVSSGAVNTLRQSIFVVETEDVILLALPRALGYALCVFRLGGGYKPRSESSWPACRRAQNLSRALAACPWRVQFGVRGLAR